MFVTFQKVGFQKNSYLNCSNIVEGPSFSADSRVSLFEKQHARVSIPPVTILKSFNWFVGLKQIEVKRRNTAQMWPRSKCWMRAHKRTFNTPRLKSHLSCISSFDFVCQFSQPDKSEIHILSSVKEK